MAARKALAVFMAICACLALHGVAEAGVVSFEDFESGASGWSNSITEDSGHPAFTSFLGRFGGTGGVQAVTKTYALSGDELEATIQFDLYEIDSWDGEYFRVYINDTQVANDLLTWQGFDDPPNATPLFPATSGGMGNYIYSTWNDQSLRYTFTIPTSATSIKLGFGSTLNSGLADESWGIDNVLVTEYIPEPCTFALTALGLSALAAHVRRRRA